MKMKNENSTINCKVATIILFKTQIIYLLYVYYTGLHVYPVKLRTPENKKKTFILIKQ